MAAATLGRGDFERLLLADTPLLDVRAPSEFAKGAFPRATNLPLLNDGERGEVGRRYRAAGHEAAIELGHELVSGDVKACRLAGWRRFAADHPHAALYCFRGGLRSRIAEQWLREVGASLPRIEGGYKALRRFLIESLERDAAALPWLVLGGRTGTGKTRLLRRLPRGLDLEGHAHHRGSAFGPRATAQSTQIDFENALAVDLLKLATRPCVHAVVEDESRHIGRRQLPAALYGRMARRPLVVVEDTLEARVQRTFEDFVEAGLHEHEVTYGEAGFDSFASYLRHALARIRKRLGGERHEALAGLMDTALDTQARTGELDDHRDWIRPLLRDYYDPMYDHQLAARRERIAFIGAPDAVKAWLVERCTTDSPPM